MPSAVAMAPSMAIARHAATPVSGTVCPIRPEASYCVALSFSLCFHVRIFFPISHDGVWVRFSCRLRDGFRRGLICHMCRANSQPRGILLWKCMSSGSSPEMKTQIEPKMFEFPAFFQSVGLKTQRKQRPVFGAPLCLHRFSCVCRLPESSSFPFME